MPEDRSPGVDVEEVDTGNKPIAGVSTSTVGFLGVAERGPVIPTLVTSFAEYVGRFGGYVANAYLARAVEGFFQNGGLRCFIQRVVSSTAATANAALGDMTVMAVGPGAWASRIWVKVSTASRAGTPETANLFKLNVMYWSPLIALPLPLVDPTVPISASDPNFHNLRQPTVLEVFDNLSTDPLASNFYESVVNGISTLVKLTHTGPARPPDTADTPGAFPFMAGGDDGGELVLADYQGNPAADPSSKTGLAAFEDVDEISILCCPEEPAMPDIANDIVVQCERLKDRFAIVQAPENAPAVANHKPTVVSKYAAYYYPWLNIVDPQTGITMLVPPSGHIAGIYARTDTERGVHKAPANQAILGIQSLQVNVTKGEQDILESSGVDVLRNFPGLGDLVWGARTTSDEPDWKYVNVRRLLIFVEQSIQQGTDWVVFEPNGEPLWARVRRSVSDFLRRLLMDGMLQGATPDQAYFVRCDQTTMTQSDLDNGRLIMQVGVAAEKPAEFVIFRIGQWTGGSCLKE